MSNRVLQLSEELSRVLKQKEQQRKMKSYYKNLVDKPIDVHQLCQQEILLYFENRG